MSDKKRKRHNQRWDVARKLSDVEFWKIIEELFERSEKDFSLDAVASLTYREMSEFEGALSVSLKHHIFISVQYAPSFKKQKRKKYPSRNTQDRSGTLMSSIRERHEEATGENRELIYWEEIVQEKIELEKKTGIRHSIVRIDKEIGFDIENLIIKQQTGKKRFISEYPAIQASYT